MSEMVAGAAGLRISDILTPELVVANMAARDKKAALQELCEPLTKANPELDRESMVRILLDRERLGSTGVGEGVAIPHGKLSGIKSLLAVFGRSLDGVDFASLDDKPAHLFFVLFAPEDAAAMHLKALARISRLLKNAAFRKRLMEADGAAGILEAIAEEESRF